MELVRKFETKDLDYENDPIDNAIKHYLKTLPHEKINSTLTNIYLSTVIKKINVESYIRLDGLKLYKSLLTKNTYVNEKTLIDRIILNKLAGISASLLVSSFKFNNNVDINSIYEKLYTKIKTLLKDK